MTSTGTATAPRAGLDRLRLLVIDDDETDRLAVRRCLQQSGIPAAVNEARSAAEALEFVAATAYDCVLLDYYLPDMPGLEVFERIRAASPDMPVVIFTGRGDEDAAVELMRAGAADYLPKSSMSPERLAAALRHATELARATRARRLAEDELRAQESRFRTLANAISQLAWMTDASGARYWFNQRWLDYTGETLESMQGWGWQKVHHPDHIERVTGIIRRSCASGEPWEDVYPLRGGNGTYRWFLSRALPVRRADGAIAGWVGTNTDITDQKNAAAEREALLAREHEARAAAEHASAARDELLAIVAHDLRNPLQIIMSAARAVPSLAGEKRHLYVQAIQRSAREMNRLIDDLLDSSRMERGNFAIERRPVDLRQVLQETRELFDLAAQEGKIALDWDVDAAGETVSADRDRIFQVVANLLNNAIKFTPEGGRVSLRAQCREGNIEIVVRDSGPGIPAADLANVFDRYWQGDRASRAGAGLGLSICKGIVEAHGGRIWVESTAGVGTTIHVAIPARSPEA